MKTNMPEIISLGIFNLKAETVTKERTTTMFEIELPIKKGGISYIDADESHIDTNMIICAKPGHVRHTRAPYICYYIHMNLSDGMLFDTLINMPNYIRINRYEQYYQIFKGILEYYNSGLEYDKIILQSLILKLIYVLITDSNIRTLDNNTKKNNNYIIVEEVKKYIKDNLVSDLSLDTLSNFAGFSPVHFHNLFKSATGKCLREYVEEQRIKKRPI